MTKFSLQGTAHASEKSVLGVQWALCQLTAHEAILREKDSIVFKGNQTCILHCLAPLITCFHCQERHNFDRPRMNHLFLQRIKLKFSKIQLKFRRTSWIAFQNPRDFDLPIGAETALNNELGFTHAGIHVEILYPFRVQSAETDENGRAYDKK